MDANVEAAAAAAPTEAPTGAMPSVEDMTSHLQQARGDVEEAPATEPEGEPELEEQPEEGLEDETAGDEEQEEPEDAAEDGPKQRAKPSQSDRLKTKLQARETEYKQLSDTFGRQQDTLEEIHGENLHFRAQIEDLQYDYQEQSAYVKQLEAAVERLTDGRWQPDPREAQLREQQKQLRRYQRQQQFQEQYAKQQQQREHQLQREANTRRFAGNVQDVARRFNLTPRRLARVALSERAFEKGALEQIARDLRGASKEAKQAKQQVQKNRKAPRPVRANGQVRSRAPSDRNDPLEDIQNEMLAFMQAGRGRGN